MSNGRSQRYETFIAWYLRFNGYFTVPSFIVHAGDDAKRISGGVIGPHTEIDTLGVRLPYSREKSGVDFPTCKILVDDGAIGRFDIVIAETKSGDGNSPNNTWQLKDKVSNLEYMLRFIGWHQDDAEIEEAAKELQEKYRYEGNTCRIRYIVFSKEVDRHWSKKGVQYIRIGDCIRFIAEERGQCWATAGIGRRSMHDQWSPLVNKVFEIANNDKLDATTREQGIWRVLNGE